MQKEWCYPLSLRVNLLYFPKIPEPKNNRALNGSSAHILTIPRKLLLLPSYC